jgi:hypothetical protein
LDVVLEYAITCWLEDLERFSELLEPEAAGYESLRSGRMEIDCVREYILCP